MHKKILLQLNKLRSERKAAVIVTEIASGASRLIEQKHAETGELGAAIDRSLRTGKSGMVTINQIEFFLNAYVPAPRLVVIGAVHISQALAQIAEIAGFDLEIIDPRTAFATSERFENASLHADWPDEVLAGRPLDPFCALAAVTHDPKIDDIPLQLAINADCFYVGALGSKKTHAKRCERLREQGLTVEQLERIRAPIGLDIGASSPQEIAVAIMAEVIHAFRTRGTSE